MCCLFGLMDTQQKLTTAEKIRITSTLGKASEARGTDATGFAYNSQGRLQIVKQPLPAQCMHFRIPYDAFVVMGHTRMMTQGSARKGRNNHPFFGRCSNMQFALAHNGVLSNDKALRKAHKVPQSKIETDSYVAVQLLEQHQYFDLNSIKAMAETVKGTFTFTMLDRENRLYFVKGNNPMCLYYFPEKGLYLYASTKPILQKALQDLGYNNYPYQEVEIDDGEILMIDKTGTMQRATFQPPVPAYCYYSTASYWRPAKETDNGYSRFLSDLAETLGISAEIEYLRGTGLSIWELEECVYDKDYRMMCLIESGYYEEMEGEYCDNHCFEGFPWM